MSHPLHAQPATPRALRVAERIRVELSDVLLRGSWRDSRLQSVVITAVKVARDLRLATVYVRTFDGAMAGEAQTQLVASLRKAIPEMRRRLAPRLRLRYVPELRVFWDSHGEEMSRIESLLDQIRSEKDRTEENHTAESRAGGDSEEGNPC